VTDIPAAIRFAALTIGCTDPELVAEFYRAAGAGEITRRDADSAFVTLGGVLLIFRKVEDFEPPTWPSQKVPMQMHVEFYVDDLKTAEAQLQALGATTSEHQPHQDPTMLVMVDPAGHPF
jgi:hypothetical protein